MAVFKLDLLGSIMVSYGGILGKFKHLWTLDNARFPSYFNGVETIYCL